MSLNFVYLSTHHNTFPQSTHVMALCLPFYPSQHVSTIDSRYYTLFTFLPITTRFHNRLTSLHFVYLSTQHNTFPQSTQVIALCLPFYPSQHVSTIDSRHGTLFTFLLITAITLEWTLTDRRRPFHWLPLYNIYTIDR